MLDKINKINEGLTHYVVELTTKCVDETGQYINGKGPNAYVGYAVRNKDTNIVEYSTSMLPQALFQADYLNKSLCSLLNPPPAPPAQGASEDVFCSIDTFDKASEGEAH